MDYSRAARTYAKQKASECEAHSQIPKELYDHYGVKKGLRDRNGRGVLTGLTNISRIKAFDNKRRRADTMRWRAALSRI